MSAAVGITPSAAATKISARARVRELERDRDRDERDEQVRPAVAAQQEPPQVEALTSAWVTRPSLLAAARVRETYGESRSAHFCALAASLPALVDAVGVLLEVLRGARRAPTPEPEPSRSSRARRRGLPRPSPPSWPSSWSNGLAFEGSGSPGPR